MDDFLIKHLPDNIAESVAIALQEDLGNGDVTAALVDASAQCSARVISREPAVLAGSAWFDETFRQLDASIQVTWNITDGQHCQTNELVCTVVGNARAILSGERTALNFLQTLSATATTTSQYATRIAHTKAQILDTRKTIPGLRAAQKYAVLCGGGKNHRKGLYDGVLIKENHIVAAGSISQAVANARRLSSLPVEVEVESLDEVKQALAAGADILLLDNMDISTITQAVEITNHKAKLEASGGVSLETITNIAETGVDFISIGDLTKNIRAIDLSMRFQLDE